MEKEKKRMKMKKNITLRSICKSMGLVLLTLTGLFFTSCIKDGNDTIVIPLPDGKIPYSVIPRNLQDSLTQEGFAINEGITPPNIEGMYLAAPLTLHYASDGYTNNFYDLTMTFNNQKPRGMITYAERQRDTVEGASIVAQVIGHDSCFTMYCYQYISDYSGATRLWNCKIATVVSGTVTDNGIHNCQYSYIMLEKEAIDDYYLSQLAKEETFRIYNDGDGLAVKIQ